MSYQIFSDGACDLGLEEMERLNIVNIPFYVSLDGENYYKELEELELDDFFEQVVNNKDILPKTSLPSVQDYIDAFEVFLKDGKDVICFTITNSLSGSVQSAGTAKMMLDEKYKDRKIYIVNSTLATVSQGLLVKESVRMRDAGLTVDENFEKCEKLKITGRVFFYVGDLHYLIKGGRIGKLSSLAGSLLKIIPLIILEDAEIHSAGVSRNKRKAKDKIVSLVKEHFKKLDEAFEDYVFVMGACTEQGIKETEEIVRSLSEFFGKNVFDPIGRIGATIATHTGPEAVGLGILKRFECI